jgi:hypothetical protein
MKISFDTPKQYTDGTNIPAAALAAAKYFVLIDTANPPVTSFQVPAAIVAAAVANPDGTKRLNVDAVKDLGFNPTPGTPYFVEAKDSIGGVFSAATTILPYTYSPTPEAPANFSVA